MPIKRRVMALSVRKRLAFIGAVLGVAGGSLIAAPGSAAASASAYNGACGSGYSVIRQVNIAAGATVYLTYSSSSGYNCVVTRRNVSGAAEEMEAWIELAGRSDTFRSDYGYFGGYAGPVYLYAKGSCVDYGGFWRGGAGESGVACS